MHPYIFMGFSVNVKFPCFRTILRKPPVDAIYKKLGKEFSTLKNQYKIN